MNDLENDAERDAISADMYLTPSNLSDTRTIRRRASLTNIFGALSLIQQKQAALTLCFCIFNEIPTKMKIIEPKGDIYDVLSDVQVKTQIP
jgi:hypothetical protein